MWKDRNVTLVSILLFIFCKFTCNSLFFSLSLSLSLSLCTYKFPRKIVDRIDSNVDGYITTDELKAWIKRVQKRYVYENVAKVWSDYDLNKDNKISWDEYKQATYGYYLGEYFWSETFNVLRLMSKSYLHEIQLLLFSQPIQKSLKMQQTSSASRRCFRETNAGLKLQISMVM